MTALLAYFHVHYVLAFFVIVLSPFVLIAAIHAIFKIYNRTLRCINIVLRGWPPWHLDADGDFLPLPKQGEM